MIFASKEQLNDGGLVAAETNHIYNQPIQDNIAAESEVAKRGAASGTSTSSGSESQGQSSQIDVGKFWTPLLYQCMGHTIASQSLHG